MLAPIALHAAPPARPAPPIAADTAVRDSNYVHLYDLSQAVLDTLEARGLKSPSGLLAVSVGVGGAGAQMSIIGGNVPDSLRRSVGRLVSAYANRRGTATPLAFTIRLEHVVRALRPLSKIGDERRPRLRSADMVRRYMGRLVESFPALQRGEHQATIDMYVDPKGRVSIVYIAEWAGPEDVTPYLTGLASELEFTPARVAGQPVPAWVTQTFTFAR